MTIVFQLGNSFWIEVFTVPRESFTGSTVSDRLQTLEKTGQFISAAVALDIGNLNATALTNLSCTLQLTDGTELVVGQNISTFNMQMGNSTGTQTFGAHVIMLLRGRGG